MKKMISIIISIIALTVMAPGHAKEVGKQSDLDCLAKNIYYEAASQSTEGKAIVGLVTINRSNSGYFPTTICGVVDQRSVMSIPREVTTTKIITEGIVFKTTRHVTKTVVVWSSRVICQFSWRCENVRKIKSNDSRWDDSVQVAQELLSGGFKELRDKYGNALYFHSRFIKPTWAKQKVLIGRVGDHLFYSDRNIRVAELTYTLD